MTPEIRVQQFGLLDYPTAQAVQERALRSVTEGGPDRLLLMNLEPVISLGRPASRRFLRVSEEELIAEGYRVVDAGRGGEVTFHGPEQLVVYPVLALLPPERDLHLYLRGLEDVGIEICRHYGLQAERLDGRSGVWVCARKIMACGIRVRRWVTSHGFALNRGRNQPGFTRIVPCGIADAEVTSLETELGRPVPEDELRRIAVEVFAQRFRRAPMEDTLETAGLKSGPSA